MLTHDDRRLVVTDYFLNEDNFGKIHFEGVGGGTIRDVLLNQVPSVLRFEVYATAALVGSVCMIAATRMRLPAIWAASLGGVICFLLRVVSMWQHWSVPRALG
jgi:uncharacterized membrane protein YeiH